MILFSNLLEELSKKRPVHSLRSLNPGFKLHWLALGKASAVLRLRKWSFGWTTYQLEWFLQSSMLLQWSRWPNFATSSPRHAAQWSWCQTGQVTSAMVPLASSAWVKMFWFVVCAYFFKCVCFYLIVCFFLHLLVNVLGCYCKFYVYKPLLFSQLVLMGQVL